MVKEILPFIPKHKIYVEPFFGSGAVFFAKEPSRNEVINDTNDFLITFYRVMHSRFEELCNMIEGTLHSESEYKRAKDILKGYVMATDVEIAWAVWVQTNMSFTNKIFGGFEFSKDKTLAASKRRKREQFLLYKNRLKDVMIFNRDALDVIKIFDSEDTFYYLDPPYLNANQGHYAGYTENDLTKLLEVCEKMKGKFLLSHYPNNLIKRYVDKNKWYYFETEKLLTAKMVGFGEKIHKKTEVLVANYKPQDSAEKLLFSDTR